MQVVELPLRLPGLNEYQRACRASPFIGAQMKKRDKNMVMSYLGGLSPAKWPVNIEVFYIEPNSRRDKDNVSGYGMKVIGDALVSAGIIPDDNSSYITKLTQSVICEKDVSKIIVQIIEHDDPDFSGDTNEEVWVHIDKITGGVISNPRPKTVEELISESKKNKKTRRTKNV